VVKVRSRLHALLQTDYKKRDLPELCYAILTTVRDVDKCRYTYLLNRVGMSQPRFYFYLKMLERCGYLEVDRVGKRRVYVTITNSGRGLIDDLKEYLRVRQMYTKMFRELREKFKALSEEGTVYE
jgi:predicted transcriptional regulator